MNHILNQIADILSMGDAVFSRWLATEQNVSFLRLVATHGAANPGPTPDRVRWIRDRIGELEITTSAQIDDAIMQAAAGIRAQIREGHDGLAATYQGGNVDASDRTGAEPASTGMDSVDDPGKPTVRRPADVVRDTLLERALPSDYLVRFGFRPNESASIADGSLRITADVAGKLERAFGAPAGTWRAVQRRYDDATNPGLDDMPAGFDAIRLAFAPPVTTDIEIASLRARLDHERAENDRLSTLVAKREAELEAAKDDVIRLMQVCNELDSVTQARDDLARQNVQVLRELAAAKRWLDWHAREADAMAAKLTQAGITGE